MKNGYKYFSIFFTALSLVIMLIRANTKFVDNSCYYYLIINHQSEMQMVDDILRN